MNANPSAVMQNILVGLLIVVMTFGCAFALVVVQRLDVSPSQVRQEVMALRKQVSQIDDMRSEAEMVMAVVEQSELAIVGLDTSGRITLWSRGAELMFGTPKEEALGYGIAFMIPRGSRDNHRVNFEGAMRRADGHSFQQIVECNAKHSSGELMPVRITVWGVPGRSALAIVTKQTAGGDGGQTVVPQHPESPTK